MDGPRKRALGAATGMQTIEKVTDADIAEVYQSKNLFEGIESMTSELTGLLTLVHAIEWRQPKTKIDMATIQEWTKGTFGDPVKVAMGAVTFGGRTSSHGMRRWRRAEARFGDMGCAVGWGTPSQLAFRGEKNTWGSHLRAKRPRQQGLDRFRDARATVEDCRNSIRDRHFDTLEACHLDQNRRREGAFGEL
jgi:hypothetical protein